MSYHRKWLVPLWASDPLLSMRTGAVDGSLFSDETFATLDEGDIDFLSCPWKWPLRRASCCWMCPERMGREPSMKWLALPNLGRREGGGREEEKEGKQLPTSKQAVQDPSPQGAEGPTMSK